VLYPYFLHRKPFNSQAKFPKDDNDLKYPGLVVLFNLQIKCVSEQVAFCGATHPQGLNGDNKPTWKTSSLSSRSPTQNEQRVSPPPKASKPRSKKDFKAQEEGDDEYGE
jgi:hypothetical protein